MEKMLYNAAVLLIQGGKISKYGAAINEALYMVMPHGSLDIYLLHSPATLMDVERTIREVYEVARHEAEKVNRKSVRISVLPDGRDFDLNRQQVWDVVVTGNREAHNAAELRQVVPPHDDFQRLPVVVVRMNEEEAYEGEEEKNESKRSGPENDTPEHRQLLYTTQFEHNVAAVGGTFDHLHDGHKLLLTMAGYLAREELIVGITGPELLKNKKYADAMQSYAKRKENVEHFMRYVFPELEVSCSMINDVYGPTATIQAIDALVVSRETRSGGAAVNKMRREKNWNELKVYEVDLIGGSSNPEDKLSSTELRRQELESRREDEH